MPAAAEAPTCRRISIGTGQRWAGWAILRIGQLELRQMARSPPMLPEDTDRDVYLVLDHFGILGRVWHETDEADAKRTKLIQDLLDGQYEDPARIVAFNTAEGWSRDVTDEIARE